MKRLQFMIEEDLDALLERQAGIEGVSKAALLRRYAAEQLRPAPALEGDALWEMLGAVEGDAADSQVVDDVVYGAP